MILVSLDSSHRDESNGTQIIQIVLLGHHQKILYIDIDRYIALNRFISII